MFILHTFFKLQNLYSMFPDITVTKKFISLGCICCLALMITSCSVDQNNSPDHQKETERLGPILEHWAEIYTDKVGQDYQAIVNFSCLESDTAFHLVFREKEYNLYQGLHPDAPYTLKSTLAHYNRIYRKELTGFTSLGREDMSDTTPLDVEFHQPLNSELMNDFLHFVQRFFNPSPHDKVTLSEEQSRVVHGGNAIPLFYQQTDEVGVRSAWYQIHPGQQVNEPGDTNPFPQYFIITEGKGLAKIGADTLRVSANEAYYIAPGLDHVFWTDQETPMEMIFLAWGKGA